MKKLLCLIVLLIPIFGSGQIITTIAGNDTAGFSGDNGPAISALLNGPNNITFDKAGNMYICDVYNNRIRKINTSGIITTIAGNGVLDYTGDGGQATAAALYYPVSVVADSGGNLYIATNADSRIRRVNTAGIITTIAGNGVSGYNGDNISATSAQLYAPYVGAIDNAGDLFFSDANNHRIRKIDVSGLITTVAGNGMNSYAGDNEPATAAELKDPAWICLTPSRELYIADNLSHCVRKINSSGIITTFAGTGTATYSGDGGPATSAGFIYPDGIAIDNSGNIFVADYGANVIRKIDNSGVVTTIAGTGSAGFSGDGGPSTSAQLNGPNYVAINAFGNLFIADLNNNRIREIIYHPEAVNNIVNTQNSVSIYPNPAYNEVTIKATDKIETLQIQNIVGQAVYAESYNYTSTAQVNISSYSSGVYFIKINGVYAGKFVKE